MGPAAFDDTLKREVAERLATFERVELARPGLKPAAVALTLVRGAAGAPAFLLTRRPATMNRHAGQFALPGGRIDHGEEATAAARRELLEELGVELGDDAVLGLLDDFATRSGYVITPVVLWGSDVVEVTPNPEEVAIVYRVPLSELYRGDIPFLHYIEGSSEPVLSLPLVGTEVYSPTAAIIYQFRELALEGRATRVYHYEQPRFAWR